jgi:hypothetical protein
MMGVETKGTGPLGRRGAGARNDMQRCRERDAEQSSSWRTDDGPRRQTLPRTIVVVMEVSGSEKTTVAAMLA